MSRIALGSVQFGMPYGLDNLDPVSQTEVYSILHNAYLNNINVIDTAISYGNSEEVLGNYGIEKYKIITKLPAIPERCLNVREWIDQQFKNSLSRLQVDKVYGFMLHNPEQLLTSNGTGQIYESLKILKKKGLVEKIGMSIYSPNILELTINNFSIDIIQAPFNVFDRRLYNTGWMQRLKSMEVEIHIRSIFLQGLLLSAINSFSFKFSKWNDKFKAWHDWLFDNNISAFEAAVNFAFSFDEVDQVVVSFRSTNEMLGLVNVVNSKNKIKVPDFSFDDENLINPYKWNKL